MNRFERECQVSPSLFRHARDCAVWLDPLRRRAASVRYAAACARFGRPMPAGAAASPEVIRRMGQDVWAPYLRHLCTLNGAATDGQVWLLKYYADLPISVAAP